MLGLLLGCGLRRSEVVGLRLDQLQLRESRWVIVDLVGKGGRIRTVPVPNWCKGIVDVWLRDSGVNEGKVFRRVLKNGARQDAGVTANVVWYAVKRCAKRAGIGNLAPHDLRRSCAPLPRVWRRTRTDPVSAWPRLGTNDRTVHRMQAKPQRSGQ
jgi:integrase